MAFRADEAAQTGYDDAESYLTRNLEESVRVESKRVLKNIARKLGPAINSYPSWHPLVCNHDPQYPVTHPSKECGYNGLDHTKYFVNGFITCPYGDGKDVIDSVENLPEHPIAYITAERLDVQLYAQGVTPILVECVWEKPLDTGLMIPLHIAMPLILQYEIPCWKWSSVAETWETMRPYFLGTPHGKRSSLFINQETGQSIKKIWESIILTGMFGPIKK